MRALALSLALLTLASPAHALGVGLPASTAPAPDVVRPAPMGRDVETPMLALSVGAGHRREVDLDDASTWQARVELAAPVDDAPPIVVARAEAPVRADPTWTQHGASILEERAPIPAPPVLTRRLEAPPIEDSPPQRAFLPPAHAASPRATRDAPEASGSPRDDSARPAPGGGSVVRIVALGAALLLLAPWALYHRLRGQALLAQGTRARAMAHLRASPGATPADVARALDIDPSTALYHLRRLAREGLVVAEGPTRSARYFEAGAHAATERSRLVAARDAAPVLDAIRAQPGASKAALARALGLARPTLSWHLARLRGAGLVREERDGRHVRVYLA